ncbi:heavy metal-binding domain-containing protein [Cytobacillus sp. FSL R5-0569]|uniref:heavy metal-binding domain-containing protein n=1 Tax=Cytobacillus sp. FSL R5-0569 TaxID=2921649 RepID=UPI0030FB2598
MIISTGDIKEKYEILNVYYTYAASPIEDTRFIRFTKEKDDMIIKALDKVNLNLIEYAENIGGNGIIHLRYDTKFFNQDKNVMVTGYGTVIKLID